MIFSVGGGPGGIGGSTFSGGGGPGGGAGIFAGEPGGFLVGEVGVDIAATACGCGFTVQSLCERAHTVVSLAKVAEPMMLCVEVLGTTFSIK